MWPQDSARYRTIKVTPGGAKPGAWVRLVRPAAPIEINKECLRAKP